MDATHDLLERIRTDRGVADRLALLGDFDVTRLDPVEELVLPGGTPLRPVAGCAAGGTYFLCGAPDSPGRPVLYADSEGQAALIAGTLAEAVVLFAVLPSWIDLLAGFPMEEMEAQARADHPDLDRHRDHVLHTLGLTAPPVEDVLRRLCAAAARTSPGFVPVAASGDRLPYALLHEPWEQVSGGPQ